MNDFETGLDKLIDRIRSGEASAEEIAEIEELLVGDAELRKRYRARMRMESHLIDSFQQHQSEMLPFEPASQSNVLSVGNFYSNPILAVAAGVILLATLTVAILWPKAPEPVAKVENVSGAAWEGALNITSGTELAPGILRLKAGMANIRFSSGALVALEAPAEFEIESAMRSRLISGKALVEAPESAHGFVMLTPHGYITDLGTRFSVSVDEKVGKAECEVLEGEISLHHDQSGKVEHLLDQQASVMDAGGIRELELLPSTFVQNPAVRFIRLGTEGKETSVVRSDEREELLHPSMLMVKKSFQGNAGKADRRALFSIGLREIDGSTIDQVKLRLNLVPSGLGFAAYMPEKVTFSVYGVIDESREGWATDGLLWQDAPGYLADSKYQLKSDEARLLGSFDISRGQQRGTIVFESKDLVDFVKSDTTGVCSFIVVRETAGNKNFSLVHAFAGNQHPEARGPTLEVFPKQ